MEQALIEILLQMPVVAILVGAWWYYRKDMLARVEQLEERLDRYQERDDKT